MDIIVLGLLMMKETTIYELHKIVSEQLTFASSGSMGSIQASIKKLLNKGMLTYEEKVEGGVNKKIYAITEVGKKYFIENISTPMQSKTTNKELSKFFFMGFVDSELREELINCYIKELEMKVAKLEEVNAKIGAQRNLVFDEKMINEIKAQGGATEFLTVEVINEVNKFTIGTLDYGIDFYKFEIEWFTKFKEKIKRKRGKNERD